MNIARKTEAFMDVATELLERGHRVRFRAEGGSMHPAIRGGDAIVVEPVSSDAIQRGDVVLYRTAERVIAHRVIDIDSGIEASPVFTLRGDAAGSAEEPVQTHQVLGRVAAVERKGWGARLRGLPGSSTGLRARAAAFTAVMVVAVLAAAPAFAASKSWVGTTGGSWTTGANWSPAGAPAAGDDITIPADQSGDITNVPTISLNSLIINGTCDFESNPTGNTITVTSLFTVAAGKTMVTGSAVNGRLEFTLGAASTGTIAGTVDINSGNLGDRVFLNNGDLTITATGLITNSQGTSVFTNAAGATLRIGSAGGITTAPTATGNIRTSTRTFDVAGNYVYNGTSNQNTGNGLPAGVTGSVTIDNPGNTVTLNSAESIGNGGELNLVSGTFATGSNLTMASTSSINRSGGSMTGTPQGAGVYDVTYTGSSKTTGTELSGNGLRTVTVNLTAGQTLTLDVNRVPDGNLVLSSGTFDLATSTINRSAGGGTFSMAAGTTLLVGGATNFPSNYGTNTLNVTSTVDYYRLGAQTVDNVTYGNLILSGSGNKDTSGTTTVAGNLTITDGPNFLVQNTLNVTGATTVGGGTSGTLTIDTTTGTKAFTGLVTVNAGGTWVEDVNEPITFRGGITNNGTFTANNGVHTFDTNDQALTGTFSIPNVTVTGGGVTLTNNNALTVGTALSGTGELAQAANATLNVGGTSAITTLTATATDNEVNYTGGAQAIKPVSYYHLAFSGGNKTAAGGVTIVAGGTMDQGCTVAFTATGVLTLDGSYLNCNSSTVGGSGNLTVGGITVNASGSFDYIGAAAGTPTVTLTGNVVNNGDLRIWGGGRDGAGSPTCPAAPPTIVTATASRSWSGSGNIHLTNLSIDDQNATVPITAWNSTNVSGNTGSWTFTSGTCEFASPTAVKVSSFAAAQTGKGVRISLKTSRDVNNLGFNLYREVNGQKVKLNASLLAGTALMGGAGTSFTAGQSRRWHHGGGSVGDVYWLEEVDLNGIKTWYGPVAAQGSVIAAKAMATDSGPSQSLQSASDPIVSAGAQDEELEAALTLSRVGSVSGAAGMRAASAVLEGAKQVAKSVAPSQNLPKQQALAAGAAVRLGVNAEGWYRVTQPELVAAGISSRVDPRTLQLYVNGIQQPIVVQTAVAGRFGPSDAIYFHGMGIDTTWSDTQAYWLVAGPGLGLRMTASSLAAGTRKVTSFPATVAWKPRTLYFAALLNGDGNNFFGPVVTDVPTSQDLTVSRLNASGGASKLQVKLQGGTTGAHAVTVALNGTVLGQAHFSGQDSVVATFAVPALNEGANTLTLTAANQDDVSAVDEVRLTYPRRYTAEGDALRFTVTAGSTATIDGFSTQAITAIDITNPAVPSLVQGKVTGSAGNYALTLLPAGAGTRTLLAVGNGGIRTPTVAANGPSSLHGPQAGHDMVIIGHASLLASAEPLADLRESQGLDVALIDVQDIYDEFNYGVKSPNALKAFLSAAKANWTVKPTFVLLLGNGTFDPRDFLGTGVPDLVPAKLVDSGYLETASDDWFVDFNNDAIPDMAIGRLPAESVAAADLMVGRTVAYDEQIGSPWMTRALLVSGQNQEPDDDFETLSVAAQAALPGDMAVTNLVQGVTPNPAGTLIAGINAGQGLVNYIGHGSNEVWGSGLFDSSTALGLANGDMTPIVLSMTCLNGYFQDVYTAALGKALLTAPGGGAVAVWASSGLSDPGPQSTMNQAMVQALYGNPAMTIGQAAAAAKAATSDINVRRTWILLGDPSVVLQ